MDKLIRRTVTTAAFTVVLFAAMFLCMDRANAVVDIQKDGSQLTPGTTYGTFEDAVNALNSRQDIDDGDDITFVIHGDTFPGEVEADACRKRINLEIRPNQPDDEFLRDKDHALCIKNVESVHIHDMGIRCPVSIRDSASDTDVNIEGVSVHNLLDIKDVGSLSIDGTRPDGSRSKVAVLNITGGLSKRIQISKIKGIETDASLCSYIHIVQYDISYADCDLIDDCRAVNSQIRLKNSTVRTLSNTEVTHESNHYSYNTEWVLSNRLHNALELINSRIDLLKDSSFFTYNVEYEDGDPVSKMADGGGSAVSATMTSVGVPNLAIGTMRNCILYGADNGLLQGGGGADVGTIDSCIIMGRNRAILQTGTLFSVADEIGQIKGDTVLFSIHSYAIGGTGNVSFEPSLNAGVGNVRIARVSAPDLFNGGKKTLPSGYSWRNDNRDLSVLKTHEALKPYILYDLTEFYYLSYDKCRVTYHPGAGYPSADFDEYYDNGREYPGGAKIDIKGIDQEVLNYADYGSPGSPMTWTYDALGEEAVATADEMLTVSQKSYDFYPGFPANSFYNVEFVTGEAGSKVETQQVFNRDKPTEPAEPTHPGATFVGWYYDEDCTDGNECDFSESLVDKIDANRTVKLYAKWDLYEYTVTFNSTANGGKTDTQETVKWGEQVEPPAQDPEYSNPDIKSLKGWYKTSAGKTEFDFDTAIKKDTTIYAVFKYNKSTIILNMAGGTVSGLKSPWKKNADGNIVYKGEVEDCIDTPWAENSKPTKGYMYTFDGLYEDPEFNVPFAFEGEEYPVPTSRTYYAKFSPKKYTVKYYYVSYEDYQKDTSINPVKEESLPYGTEITYGPEELAPKFNGWDPHYVYGSSIYSVSDWDGTVIGYEMKLFMNANPKIIYHSDIAGTKVQEEAFVREGTSLADYADRAVDCEDYNFVGWTTTPKTDGEYHYKETMPDEDKSENDRENYPCVDFFDFENSTMPDSNIHLYPVLIRDRLRVILDPKDGTIPQGLNTNQALEFTVDINEKIDMSFIRSTKKKGYRLDGWYTQSGVKWNEAWGVTPEYCAKDNQGNPIIRMEEGKNYRYYTVKLNAVWIPQEIGVYYRGIEGDGGQPQKYGTTTIGSTIVLKEAATTEGGYRIFTGWKDSKGNMHSAGEEFLFDDNSYLSEYGGYSIYGILVFEAEYREKTENEHVIRFDAQGGSNIQPIIQEEGTPVTAPDEPTREGYTFAGWAPQVPITMPEEDMVCVAQWEEIQAEPEEYTLSFDVTGGSPVDSITAEAGAELTKPEDPTKSHHKFMGWTPEFPKVMPGKDTVLTATWEPVTYNVTFDADGGKFSDGKTQAIDSGIYDAVLDVPESPTREGYEFAGWDRNIPVHIPGENITIKATWNKVESDDPVPDPEPTPDPTPGTDPDSITPGSDSLDNAKVDKELSVDAKSVSTTGSIKKKTMTINWKKVKNATNYRLAYRQAGKKWTYVWTGGKNKYILKKLKKNGLYEFKLQTVRKSGDVWTKSSFGKVNYRLLASTTQKLKAKKKGFTVTVKKVSKASGYQVMYSVYKNMKSPKTKTYKGNKKTFKVGKLKAKKKYYVRSRPYRIYKGHKYIGVLNPVKKIKTKK